jgi:hypothetical protein
MSFTPFTKPTRDWVLSSSSRTELDLSARQNHPLKAGDAGCVDAEAHAPHKVAGHPIEGLPTFFLGFWVNSPYFKSTGQ